MISLVHSHCFCCSLLFSLFPGMLIIPLSIFPLSLCFPSLLVDVFAGLLALVPSRQGQSQVMSSPPQAQLAQHFSHVHPPLLVDHVGTHTPSNPCELAQVNADLALLEDCNFLGYLLLSARSIPAREYRLNHTWIETCCVPSTQ